MKQHQPRRAPPQLGPFFLPQVQELPSESDALGVIQDMFNCFNRFFPLFDEHDFLQDFKLLYATSSSQNPSWWARINVALALGYRFRGMRQSEPGYDNSQGCRYVHNAMAVISELNVCHDDLGAIQGLLGIATLLQSSPNPGPASVLTASGLRLAQSMNLHREPSLSSSSGSLTPSEMEQRRRVFWMAYILDKDISLRMGKPFTQDDEDMDVNLPSNVACDLDYAPQSLEMFNHRISLAVVQGQVYKKLYSVQAQRQLDSQKIMFAQELDSLLAYWASAVGIESIDAELEASQGQLPNELMHKAILKLTYVHCLTLVHRYPQSASADYDLGLSRASVLGNRSCLEECRKAIRLLQIIPLGDYACVW